MRAHRWLGGTRRIAVGLLSGLLWAGCGDPTGPEELTLFVAPEALPCFGVAPRDCLQVREEPEAMWENFFDAIEGFTFEPGFFYELRVRRLPVDPVPADGSSFRYVLIEIVSKTPA